MSSFSLQSEFTQASEPLHISVHNRLFFLHVHLPDEQPVLQEHIINSIKSVGAGRSPIIIGTRFPLSDSQPNPHGRGKFWIEDVHYLSINAA